MTSRVPSPYELEPVFAYVEAELRKLGITLRQLSGELSVNFRSGTDISARTAETIYEAL